LSRFIIGGFLISHRVFLFASIAGRLCYLVILGRFAKSKAVKKMSFGHVPILYLVNGIATDNDS
jgi:hypothetical protein